MKTGDLVAIYKGKFLLSIATNSLTVIKIYKNSMIEEEAIEMLLNHINLTKKCFSAICYPSIVLEKKFKYIKQTSS